MSFTSVLSSVSAGAQAVQSAMSTFESALTADAAALDAAALEARRGAEGDNIAAAAGIAASTTVAAITLSTMAFAVGAAIPVVAAGVAGAAAVASKGAAAGTAALAAEAAAGAAVLQGVSAFAESPLGQALFDTRPRVAEGLQQAVEIVDELRGVEQRNPLLLPEPWRYMLSTLTAAPR